MPAVIYKTPDGEQNEVEVEKTPHSSYQKKADVKTPAFFRISTDVIRTSSMGRPS
jgi:predicted Fe-Mo cluster-binding NifX family protein